MKLLAWLVLFVSSPIAIYLALSGAPIAAVTIAMVVAVLAVLTVLVADLPGWAVFVFGIGAVLIATHFVGPQRAMAITVGGIAVLISFAKVLRSSDRGAA